MDCFVVTQSQPAKICFRTTCWVAPLYCKMLCTIASLSKLTLVTSLPSSNQSKLSIKLHTLIKLHLVNRSILLIKLKHVIYCACLTFNVWLPFPFSASTVIGLILEIFFLFCLWRSRNIENDSVILMLKRNT